MTKSPGVLGLLAGVLAFSVSVSAVEVSDDLRLKVQQEIDKIETEGPKMSEVMAALREAGASYLPEIVAPVEVVKYQDPERRRLMVGVYLMDMTYAATFDQRKAGSEFGQAMYQLCDLLGFPNPDVERQYREALEQIDLPGGEERLQELFKQQDQNQDWQEMLRSGDGLDLVVDGLYGFLIEGLYLTSELAVLSDYDPIFMQYISDMRDSFKSYEKVLLQFEAEPELSVIVEKDERLLFIKELLQLMGELPQLGQAELEQLRPIITQARNQVVR